MNYHKKERQRVSLLNFLPIKKILYSAKKIFSTLMACKLILKNYRISEGK